MKILAISSLHIGILFFVFNHTLAQYEEWPWVSNGKHGYELKLVESFLPQNPVILEAGAHCGEDTKVLAKKWPEGTVYAFEPCPDYFDILSLTTAHIKNIHIFPYALFSSTGRHQFYMSKTCDGASSLFKAGLTQHNISSLQFETSY